MEDVGYMNILADDPSSVFQDFESYLRTEIVVLEDDIRFVLVENNSSFITLELQPNIYTFKNICEALFNILQIEYPESGSEIVIDFDDITTKNKLVVNSGIIAINFDESLFFSTILGSTSSWNY